MSGTAWTADEDDKLRRFLADGLDAGEISTRMPGRTAISIYRRSARLNRKPVTATPLTAPPAEAAAMRDASDHAKIAQLEQKLHDLATGIHGKRLTVSTAAEPPTDPSEAWRHAEEDSARRIKFYHERSRFTVDFDKTDPGLPVAVAFVSDQHISPGNVVDHRRMREDAELIAETPGLYACLGGDGVDNHIKIRSAALAARSQPFEQYQLYEWYLGIFAPKIIALISGNHDAWTDQVAGIDMVQEIARRQRLCYSPAEARISALVGGVEYKLAFRHQYRFKSSFNLLHTVKQWWRMGEESFDIGVICHEHEPAVESFNAQSLERWGARPGAYQIGSSFTRQYGFNATRPTCPTFVLYPGERDIMGFPDIRKAVRFLKSERGGH